LLTAQQVFQRHTVGDEAGVLVVVEVGLVTEERHHSIDRPSEDGDVAALNAKNVVDAEREVPVDGLGLLHSVAVHRGRRTRVSR
jgi:hypothetical protein